MKERFQMDFVFSIIPTDASLGDFRSVPNMQFPSKVKLLSFPDDAREGEKSDPPPRKNKMGQCDC